MDAYDPALAARVWQRVRGQQEHQPPQQELLPLLGIPGPPPRPTFPWQGRWDLRRQRPCGA